MASPCGKLAGVLSTWHNDIVKNSSPSKRFSVPPYCFASEHEGEPVLRYPGSFHKLLEGHLQPTSEEIRQVLVGLRSTLNWSRDLLAAMLGVSSHVLRRWETGQRNPSAAARRLIWLVHTIALHPEKLKNGLDLIMWGKSEEMEKFGRKMREAAEKEEQTLPSPS